jgi:hypothetical protein
MLAIQTALEQEDAFQQLCGEAVKDFYLINGNHDRSDGIGPGESQTESATLQKNDSDRA